MRAFVGLPWWLAMLLGVLALPVLIVGYVVKLVAELFDEALRGRPR